MKSFFDKIANEAVLHTVIGKALLIGGILILGWTAVRLISWIAARALGSLHSRANIRLIVDKIIWYAGLAIVIINIAHVLGIDLSVLLGAAGVAGVAIGFASQTSMSNLISGLFLLSENFLTIGDEINCDHVEGTVESIDLFSVKVRTYDGKLVRIANERLIKENLTDVSYYPTRRVRVAIAIPSDQGSLEEVLKIIDTVVRNNNQVKKDPLYTIEFEAVSSSARHLTVNAWTQRESLTSMQNNLINQLYAALMNANITPLYVMRSK